MGLYPSLLMQNGLTRRLVGSKFIVLSARKSSKPRTCLYLLIEPLWDVVIHNTTSNILTLNQVKFWCRFHQVIIHNISHKWKQSFYKKWKKWIKIALYSKKWKREKWPNCWQPQGLEEWYLKGRWRNFNRAKRFRARSVPLPSLEAISYMPGPIHQRYARWGPPQ